MRPGSLLSDHVVRPVSPKSLAIQDVRYASMSGQEPQWCVECGAAHGALAMTTPGDTSMVTLKEVMQAMRGVGARIAR